MCFICLSVWEWNNVDSFVLIPNILFNFFAISTAHYSSLSDTILSGNPYNFHMLFLNNLTNSSADIPSIVVTKYVILNNLLQTTRITSFPATNSNFVIKSTDICCYIFSNTIFSLNFPTGIFILFFIL